MITLTIISVAIFLIGIVLVMIDAVYDIEWLFIVGIILMIVGGINTIAFGIASGNRTNATKIKEYPASKYTINYKITEFEGQRDTTYVLIPKEK